MPIRGGIRVSAADGRHLGLTHRGGGFKRSAGVSPRAVQRYEKSPDPSTLPDTSPEELEEVLKKCREVGDAGEHHVYVAERKRLTTAGRPDLAKRVDWVSRRAVGKGYDIKSFDEDGAVRYIEVKATIGTSVTFHISDSEWSAAERMRRAYWIYRVVGALRGPRVVARVRDPVRAERDRRLVRVASGWKVTLTRPGV